MEKQYPAKLLLLGEYSVIDGSLALALPLQQLYGSWQEKKDSKDLQKAENSLNSLHKMHSFLVDLSQKKELKLELDLRKLLQDIEKGFYFESNIPNGYGLGSSGALCAAIYDRYFINKTTNLLLLKEGLAQMEGCFHGKSSGIDPLVCYVQQPLLIKGADGIEILEDFSPNSWRGKGAIFIIDSKIARETAPLVAAYISMCKDSNFRTACADPLATLSASAIEAIRLKNVEILLEKIKSISTIQFLHMPFLIPDAFKGLWKQGLDSNLYSLKLCGAGGGGFILGFCPDWELCQPLLKEEKVSILYRM